ncbi:LiaF transmembrane domain-containing protein [Pedobacter sp.]|uniref:LiaF transmembrane domain-containing protein n=1 Tax=Pedobacter sp. TaxID=1411316 RepID=UPI003D7FFDCE
MKLDRIMWGIILLFVGGVLLLENFNVIDFYWRSVWRFWPVFLIIAGVNILFNRKQSQIGSAISIGVLVVMLGFLFYKGQQPPEHRNWIADNFRGNIDINDEDENIEGQTLNFSEPLDIDTAREVNLNISGGGTSFELQGETDSLITASVNRKQGNFTLKKEMTDSTQTLTFTMQDKKGKWSMNDGGNDVDFRLNKSPVWRVNMSMGAGEVDFDLRDYKIRAFRFDGGAAALNITVGDLLPITDVVVKTGVADVKLNIPANSGCRITSKTGLSSKDFTGFTKTGNDTYETPNYKTAANKIFINFDGGLSNFEVKRY